MIVRESWWGRRRRLYDEECLFLLQLGSSYDHMSRGRVSTDYELPPRRNIVTRAHLY